ncbi:MULTISPECIES: response regulator transcription factor [unclassified Enterobacter cloacae complex]|uniref:helix-turn-helix transcriptional regulator n=1 Tax=unclassified Enterobacter cloacae complex TaxID=2757714 RepID=UPI001872CA8B|nr:MULTISPECIES: response regulator transcription factor [unclassified Enterobacter cloacae complex]MBE4810067.1 response regulator transcription factor [Enterobacter cloacae complex sp. P44RS]MBE4827949.1 response regulator transcription factor [Enterobacter cloacae complex sp. P42RS]MBE4836255.1 response regulator transcription factor [Enterobacter cloacae complex sp. P46RS]MBE4839844.1 response regulator transcription factor [Enterobacter cloacae complex sp. P42C]
MINVIINAKNKWLCYSLAEIIKSVNKTKSSRALDITYDLTASAVARADVIILSLAPGEPYICQRALFGKKYSCVVIIMIETTEQPSGIRRPACLYGTIFINKKITPGSLESLIRGKWSDIVKYKSAIIAPDCNRCQHFRLNGIQSEISHLIRKDFDATEISAILNMNIKTFYSHKYILMKKLGLKNTHDLCTFLKVYDDKIGIDTPGTLCKKKACIAYKSSL